MNHYSDPTAARALGGINREFSRLEKKAKNLCRLLDEGKITTKDFEAAQAQFTGIYLFLSAIVISHYFFCYFSVFLIKFV